MNYTRIKFKDGERVFVVAFDVCSSSEILEQLTRRGNVPRYIKCLSKIKHHMADNFMVKGLPLEPYKFTGDGWILLFPPDTKGPELLKFLLSLAAFCRGQFATLSDELDSPLNLAGITIGVDKGPLFHATIYGKDEYVGRAIVIACRLQGAVKDVDEAPAGKALVSREVFAELGPIGALAVSDAQPKLRNIGAGTPFHCKKLTLL